MTVGLDLGMLLPTSAV